MNRTFLRQIRSSSTSSKEAYPYLYRKEISFRPDESAPPSLTVTQRLKSKENLIFGGAPNFHDLKTDDRSGKSKNKNGTMTMEEMKEFYNEQTKKDEKQKANKKEAPTNGKIRDHLKMIVKYHKQEVEELMPTAYPLLGPAGKDDDDDDDNPKSGSSSKGTASADIRIRSDKEKSGRKKRLPSANERSKPPPKKRGKK